MAKRSWKVIENHPNYKVSSMGDVMNIRTGKLLNPYDDGSGYLRVKIAGHHSLNGSHSLKTFNTLGI